MPAQLSSRRKTALLLALSFAVPFTLLTIFIHRANLPPFQFFPSSFLAPHLGTGPLNQYVTMLFYYAPGAAWLLFLPQRPQVRLLIILTYTAFFLPLFKGWGIVVACLTDSCG